MNTTTMRVRRCTFEFNFDTGALRLSGIGDPAILDEEEAKALGDFLFEVLSVQGHPPRILPLTITDVEVR